MINRSQTPKPKSNVAFEIPQIQLLKLSNGLEVYFIKKEKLPIVYTYLISFSGSKYDPVNKCGLSFLTSLLIDEGAGEYDALALNNELEKLGIISSINVDHDTFSFSTLSLKEHFIRSIELLSKIILEPRLTQLDFDRERKKVLDKITQLKDEPGYIASSAFYKRIFNESKYSFPEIGYEDMVSNLMNNDVINFYSNIFLTSNAKMIIVGNIETAELTGLLEKYFNKWKLKSESYSASLNLVNSPTKFYIVNKKETAQSELRIGHLSKGRDADDFFAAKIMNTILGGQFSSRINLNLREKRGITYGAGSSFNYFQQCGFFEVSTAVNIKNTGEAISEILKELDGIKKNITQEEIDFAKSYLIKQFPSRFETYVQTAKNFLPLIIHSLPMDYYNSYTDKLRNVSNEEILKAANENIFTDNLTIVITGDKEIILPQLKAISDEVIELDIYGNRV